MTTRSGSRGVQRADPTLDLLIQLALHAPPEATLDRARALLERSVDWPRLSALARQHRLVPIVVANLDRLGASAPADWWKRTREEARRSATRAIVLSAELIRLQRAFRDAAIASIAIKGPALGALAHGTPLGRTMSDLDLLVRERDIEAASRALLARGYRSRPPSDPEVRDFAHPTRTFRLELHRRLDKRYLPLFPLDEAAWSSLDQVDVMGVPVDVLPIELHAGYLIYHGARHHWRRLGWLSVLVDLLRSQPQRLDGEALVRDAVQRGNGAMARLAAVLMRETWPDVGLVLPVLPGHARAVQVVTRRASAGWARKEPSAQIRDPRRTRYRRVLRRGHNMVLLVDRPMSRILTALRFARMILVDVVFYRLLTRLLSSSRARQSG